MIGMMYLVLTAMLALNVSSSILSSFVIVNDSVEATNINFAKKNEGMYALFEKGYLQNKEKMMDNYDKALRAQELTATFRQYVHSAKADLISVVENIPKEVADTLRAHDIENQDNYDTPTLIFIEQGKGDELHEKMVQYKKDMMDLIDEKRQHLMRFGMKTDGPFYDGAGAEVSWAVQSFYHTVVVGAVTILNNIENEAMNIEYDVVSELYAAVSADDFKFDAIEPRVLPMSTYVVMGDNFEADVFVAAYDSKSEISATIGGQTIVGENGVVKIRRQATVEGPQVITGKINVPGVNGVQSFDFKTEYTVARPSATVSADAMNVFYIGVDNPISVSVSGFDLAVVTPSITNGSLTKVTNGSYIVRVTTPGTTKINIDVTVNGAKKTMGAREYRVKKVPDPIALVNGLGEFDAIVDKNVLANSGGIIARMKDFDFKLDVRVRSFSMSTTKSGGDIAEFKSNNNQFTPDMVNAMKNSRKSQRFSFENIVVEMPTGPVTLRSFTLAIR
ncbi:hypothetical protein FACS1894201_04980 [Bacteroidia bacterium]|nr:hypothetical protein FACS1894201_04980 [Bacteroidia bacterium]